MRKLLIAFMLISACGVPTPNYTPPVDMSKPYQPYPICYTESVCYGGEFKDNQAGQYYCLWNPDDCLSLDARTDKLKSLGYNELSSQPANGQRAFVLFNLKGCDGIRFLDVFDGTTISKRLAYRNKQMVNATIGYDHTSACGYNSPPFRFFSYGEKITCCPSVDIK
jgi:hypothetical protein